MKRSPLRRRTPLRNGGTGLRRTPLKPRSKRQRKRDQEYPVVRVQALIRDKGRCQREGCCAEATDVHHRRGRVGADLTDLELLVSLCRSCHDECHANPAWARSVGLMVRRVS